MDKEKTIVCKFGGTSMADEESVKKVEKIVKSDVSRKYIVVSAPGRSEKGEKVTDLLVDCFHEIESDGSCDRSFEKVAARFMKVALKLEGVENVLREVKSQMEQNRGYDFCVSRGEYLSALFFAKRIGYEFADAAELVRFEKSGYDAAATESLCGKRLQGIRRAVIPGFYGADHTGKIVAFSRGGSDITGAVVAGAVNADLYENWTDVDGILNADPRIVPEARIIDRMTYGELRELSYLGASVMHPEAILPLIEKNIPLNVRNTFRPREAGTLICSRPKFKGKNTVTGIAGKKNLLVLFIHKTGLNLQKNILRKVLETLDSHKISFEHMPSSIDAVNFVIPEETFPPSEREDVIEEICRSIKPEQIRILENFSIVSAVGRNMYSSIGVAGKMSLALAEAGINIRMLIQGCREINIIAGVDGEKYETAIKALYNTFLRKSL